MQAIESIPVFRTRKAPPVALAKDDAQPLDFNLEFEPDSDPAQRRADDLDASTADLRLFVGRVVSNDQMIVLMRRSNRGLVKVWGEWHKSTTWPCDHLIRGWWEAVNA